MIWQFDFMFDPIFAADPAASRKEIHFKSGQKWLKNYLLPLILPRLKSLKHWGTKLITGVFVVKNFCVQPIYSCASNHFGLHSLLLKQNPPNSLNIYWNKSDLKLSSYIPNVLRNLPAILVSRCAIQLIMALNYV